MAGPRCLGSYNELTAEKKAYIKQMRFDMSPPNSYQPVTGALNLRYFNSKKTLFWAPKDREALLKQVLLYGPTQFKSIRYHKEGELQPLGQWSEHEIRLRVCKLLKVYDLDCYKDKRFGSVEEIRAEAEHNIAEAVRLN